ncbi:MAG: phosphate acyltransferase PlsX [Candidatus Omnitrophota bacterium]|nr:MAG: phosphate acyltransferase PlsX [Candidatus Omnitrophota bacterium]RKY46538.1 MAG: phosphate acyltransferase PlsX [Candidatus Omnitrophota bacterium]HDN86524.1 phosphate acyltransferase PlsX [Candidatus Omnitrophota bacterium]
MVYRVGLDISGGDYAPLEPLKGAYLATKELDVHLVLIGNKGEIEKEAAKEGIDLSKFSIVEAKEKIDMSDFPVSSVRRKRDSSIVKGILLLKEGKIDAFVSCGNTGAVVCAATLEVGLIEGIERAGIAVLVPTLKGICLIIDVGANIDPKPLHLFQYGIMASVYYSLVLGRNNPSVGLLSIGEEATKGPDLIKNTHRLFAQAPLNFVGNLEPRDIFLGKCDCIVCDGYVGNAVLKVSEGFAEAMEKFLLDNTRKDFLGKLGFLFVKQSLKGFKKITDYAEYGGAPLLGIDGVVIIGHGRSHAYAVKNAIKVAIQELNRDLNKEIKRRVDEVCQDSRIRQILTS